MKSKAGDSKTSSVNNSEIFSEAKQLAETAMKDPLAAVTNLNVNNLKFW